MRIKKELDFSGSDTFSSTTFDYEMWGANGCSSGFLYLTSVYTAPRYKSQTLFQTQKQQYAASAIDQQKKTGLCHTSNDAAVSATRYYKDKIKSSWRMADVHKAGTSKAIQNVVLMSFQSSRYHIAFLQQLPMQI
jgi:hypothetical protein